jgi:hypothetical protein
VASETVQLGLIALLSAPVLKTVFPPPEDPEDVVAFEQDKLKYGDIQHREVYEDQGVQTEDLQEGDQQRLEHAHLGQPIVLPVPVPVPVPTSAGQTKRLIPQPTVETEVNTPERSVVGTPSPLKQQERLGEKVNPLAVVVVPSSVVSRTHYTDTAEMQGQDVQSGGAPPIAHPHPHNAGGVGDGARGGMLANHADLAIGPDGFERGVNAPIGVDGVYEGVGEHMRAGGGGGGVGGVGGVVGSVGGGVGSEDKGGVTGGAVDKGPVERNEEEGMQPTRPR